MLPYRLLLHLYPSSFRAEYGEEMLAIFAGRWRAASGALARLALLAGAVADVVPNALRAHADLLRQDARYTLRTMARSPGFAATALVVTALGIGATTATFSIADHVLLRPLPYRDPDRIVKLWQESSRGTSRGEFSASNYRDWKRRARSFEAMGAYRPLAANLVGQGEPARVSGWAVDPGLFTALGARPALGRLLLPSDDLAGAPGAVVLSDGLWRGRFGADPGILGRKVLLDDEAYTVAGVLPRGFDFPTRDTELWTATRFDKIALQDRNDPWLLAVAKLKRGVTLEQARGEMRAIAAQLEREYPKENAQQSATVTRLRDEIPRRSRVMVIVLFGAALGLLLIACTNLANLQLARALARRKELAVRTAMGAGRQRLARQLVTESLLLALIGGALGLALAAAAVPMAARLIPMSLPASDLPRVDLPILLFALLLTGVTGVGFGVGPALSACSDAESGGLKEGERAGVGRSTERLRALLVVAEVTASVALLIGSGLLLRALWRLQSTDPGFRSEGVLTMRTNLPIPRYGQTQKRALLYRRILSDVRALPGVSRAAYTSGLPMVMRGGIWGVTPEGQPQDPDHSRTASLRFVTPGFFDTMGIALRAGREFTENDTAKMPFVAVVSESLARRYWPGESPLGRRIKVAFNDREIVGVVADVRVRGFEQTSEPQVYLSYQQVDDDSIIGYIPKDLVIRVTSRPAALLPGIRAAVAKADPTLPISEVRMLADIVDADTAPRQVQLRVLGGFAALAFLLAGLGIHGLLAFTVSQRAREIGVRMALGAQAGSILRMILRQGALLAAAGVLLGTGLAYAAGRAMQALLAGVSPADFPTFAAAIALSLAMTLLGSLLPALRAARLDPVIVMRAE
jgi:putative ABC transport system permease protein